MTPSEELKKDAEFLRGLSSSSAHGERLCKIADDLEIMSTITFTPTQLLEKKVEEMLAKEAERACGGSRSPEDLTIAALWLLGRRVSSAGGKALLGAAGPLLGAVLAKAGQ